MKKYNNVNEITKAFIKKGWNKDTTFQEVTITEAKERGLLFAIDAYNKGRKIFKMNVTGNIYSDTGELLMFNIKTI
jgi:hypothetical protein